MHRTFGPDRHRPIKLTLALAGIICIVVVTESAVGPSKL